MQALSATTCAGALLAASVAVFSLAQEPSGKSVPVTVDNFIRADSDLYLGNGVRDAGGTGKFFHHREPVQIDKQMAPRA
jgi:hypothetical protein